MSSNCLWLRKGFAAWMRKHRWGLKCGEKQRIPMKCNGEQVCRIVRAAIVVAVQSFVRKAHSKVMNIQALSMAKGIMHSANCIKSDWTRCSRGAQVPGKLSFEICLNQQRPLTASNNAQPLLCHSMSSHCTFTSFSASIFHSMDPLALLSSSPLRLSNELFALVSLCFLSPRATFYGFHFAVNWRCCRTVRTAST